MIQGTGLYRARARTGRAFLLVILFSACVCTRVVRAGEEQDLTVADSLDFEARETPPGPELPPANAIRVAATHLEWHTLSSSLHTVDPRTRWLVFVEETSPGSVTVAGMTRPLRQTRIKITLPEGKPVRAGRVLGYVVHASNTDLEVLAPGDPRLESAPTLIEDADKPWPNGCGIEVVTLAHPIDLDRDNRQELVLKRYATIGSRAGRALEVIEPDSTGFPRLVPMSDYVRGIRSDELQLTEVTWLKKDVEPTLIAEHRGLEACLFLAKLGIRGEKECPDCCQVLLVLQRATDLYFYPNYVRDLQGGQLDRLRSDLKEVSIGEPELPLNSGQEASLARAAAFFYLTGSGSRSRAQLAEVLGPRATRFRTQLLLDRLERYFTPIDTTVQPQGPAPKRKAR